MSIENYGFRPCFKPLNHKLDKGGWNYDMLKYGKKNLENLETEILTSSCIPKVSKRSKTFTCELSRH